MGQGEAHFIACLLGVCSLVVVVYEVVKWVQPEITLDKLVAAAVTGLFSVGLLCATGFAGLFVALYLLIPLGLIWFGDELGSLTGLKMGVVQRRSPGFLVRSIGWVFLLLLVGSIAFGWIGG